MRRLSLSAKQHGNAGMHCAYELCIFVCLSICGFWNMELLH